MTEAFKASLGSGTSIAALLPTILALIGEEPPLFMPSQLNRKTMLGEAYVTVVDYAYLCMHHVFLRPLTWLPSS